jgi:hypothetical protein
MGQVIIYVPSNGMNWANLGTAGSAYNVTCYGANRYGVDNNSGAPYWWFGSASDYVCMPNSGAQPYFQNRSYTTYEFAFYYSASTGAQFQKLLDRAYGGFGIYIDYTWSCLTVNRYTTSGGARWWSAHTTPLTPGHNYYVQVAWNSSAGPGGAAPTIYIAKDSAAPVHQTPLESGGTGTGSWYDDSVGCGNLGNTSSNTKPCSSANTAWANIALRIYRQWDSVLDLSGGGSYQSDKYRWLGTPTQATQVSCVASNTHPLLGSVYTVSGTLQTTSGVRLANKPLDVRYSLTGVLPFSTASNYTTTDSQGNYMYYQTAQPQEWEYVVFQAQPGYALCNSQNIYVVGVPPSYGNLSADDTNPDYQQTVYFTYRLTNSSGTGIPSKSVTLYHTIGGNQYTDYTTTTDGNGWMWWSQANGAGARSYWVVYAGDTSYYASASNTVVVTTNGEQTINVGETGALNAPETAALRANAGEDATITPTESVLAQITNNETDTFI